MPVNDEQENHNNNTINYWLNNSLTAVKIFKSNE